MSSDRTERLADLVASALECAVAERAQFLSDVCGDDVALREEAESLLRFENGARDFIETPAYEILDFLNGVTEPLAAENFVLQGETESPIAQESILESESAVESVPVPEPILQRETPEPLPEEVLIFEDTAPEPLTAEVSIAEIESTERVIAQEQTPESEPTESMAAHEADLESKAIELVSEREPPHESEATEVVPASEPIFESEATEPVTTEKPILESEATELMTAPEPILEIEPTGSITAQESILASEATPEQATAPKPHLQSEAVIESGLERRKPEIERADHEKTFAAAIPQEPKPKPKSTPPPAKKASDSFEIPAYLPREPIPSRSAIWTRRLVVIAVALFAVAMVVALNSALRNAKSAQHERDLAEAARSRSERINGYLQQILSLSDQNFTSVWPVPQNRNMTVTEMLDRIAPRLQKGSGDHSDARGEMLRIIGKAYASQGQHDAAEKNLRAALQTQTAFYGAQNAEITETMVDLGILLYRREKFAEAEGLLEKGVTFLRKRNQTEGGRFNAVKLAHALDRLGAVKFYRGEVKESRAVLEEALEVATQAQPSAPDRPVLTHIKTDLGGLLVLVGELGRGETLLQEALAESHAATSAPQWETGMTSQMLGELALSRNRPPEAEKHFLAAEDIFRETLGENNLYFARNLERRATVLLLENELSSAEKLAQRSLAITKECSPQNKLPWTDPMMTLSSILIKAGRAAEGEDYLRKTIRICEEQPARNFAAIALAKVRLSQLLLSQKRFTEAENVAFEAHNQAQQHLEPQDPMRKATTNNLIEIYEAQEKHAAARAVK